MYIEEEPSVFSFRENAEQLTRRLKLFPASMLSNEIVHLKCALWVNNHIGPFSWNAERADKHFDAIIAEQGNARADYLRNGKQNLKEDLARIMEANRSLYKTLTQVVEERYNQPTLWLVRSMPNVHQNDKGILRMRTRDVVNAMCDLAKAYKTLAAEAMSSSGIYRDNPEKRIVFSKEVQTLGKKVKETAKILEFSHLRAQKAPSLL